MPVPPRPADPTVDPVRPSVSLDTPPVELSSTLLGAIQQMITSAIREQLAVLVLVRAVTPSKVAAPEQANLAPAMPPPNNVEGLNTMLPP
ncbi:UNVERIFIED_CONTAM: hypothetical protein Sradi_3580100 [Sesamum radiatum]|uniref:Uncharacterized protein n=1 Tax=Sesamum radiatum TaxID=300843 RepID=A0AAW2QGQ0_SESRA